MIGQVRLAFVSAAAAALVATASVGAIGQDQATVTPAAVTEAIAQLSSFEFAVRTGAARTLRRATPEQAAAALATAALGDTDSYRRYRALVILTGLDEKRAADVVRKVIKDRDDRLRTVAYQWFEHHPDPTVVPALLDALPREQSEFVRPALTRALAAHSTAPGVREALRPLIMRGEDLFRGAVITALGDYKGAFALSEIVEVARLDGPLQEDAITAIGLLGDASARGVLSTLQKSAPAEALPSISGALCLLGIDVPSHDAYLKKTLTFAATADDFVPLLRGVVHAMAATAARGNAGHLAALIDAGVPAKDLKRDAIALGVGLAAVRDPEQYLTVVAGRTDREGAIKLLRDAFDLIAEDFEEERFYVAVRRAFWAAADPSPRRQTAQAIIDILEF